MAGKSTIEWTESTWNPVTGCTKISEGCRHCYAEIMARRLKAMGQKKYVNGFDVTVHPNTLNDPLKLKKPQRIFVNSMGDLFHKNVPTAFIRDVFDVMNMADWHQYQVLTKREERLAELAPSLPWSENIWMGVTVENASNLHRIDSLRNVPAAIRFLSLEPLLGPLPELDLSDIDWVVVGGESGPGSRPMNEEWVLDILNICQTSGVPFFFKQWGGVHKKKAGRLLKGRTYDEYPKIGRQKKAEKIVATEHEGLLSNEQLGKIRMTFSVHGLMERLGLARRLQGCLIGHRSGDWGNDGLIQNVSITQEELNGDVSVKYDMPKLNLISIKRDKGRVHSSYGLGDNIPEIWIMTELYNQTVFMLPEEY